jgi:membrane protein implicated in regulation of membrane protease activity
VRNFFSNISLGILAVILAAGVLLMSIFFLMYGAAIGLATVFVAQPWLGWVLTGIAFLISAIVYLKIHFSKQHKALLESPKQSGTMIQKIIDSMEGIDVKEWTRQHPYQSTGAAAALGFMAAGKETADTQELLNKVILPVLIEYLQVRQKNE